MLGKLIKHEWKAVAKTLGILHLALLAMSVVGRMLLGIEVLQEEGVLWGVLLMVYILSVIAVSVGSQLFLAIRFYKNMYTDEGYLTFTLPLKPWEHIFGKLLIAAVWVLIDYVVIMCSILILVMNKEMWAELIPTWNELVLKLNNEMGVVQILVLVFIMIVSLFSVPLLYYFSISIGQLFRSHKLLASVVTYFITINVLQVISTVASSLYMVTSMEKMMEGNIVGFYSDMTILTLIVQIVMCAGAWSVTQFIMSRKLNLE